MAKQRLFPKPPKDKDDTRKPHERFSDLASKVVSVPKLEIDKREEDWLKRRKEGSH